MESILLMSLAKMTLFGITKGITIIMMIMAYKARGDMNRRGFQKTKDCFYVL